VQQYRMKSAGPAKQWWWCDVDVADVDECSRRLKRDRFRHVMWLFSRDWTDEVTLNLKTYKVMLL